MNEIEIKKISDELKKKWEEVLKNPIDETKSFLQNGAWEFEGSKLLSFVHKNFRVNVTFEEMIERNLEDQARLIHKKIKENPYPKDLKCIEKRDPKIEVKPSFQQQALFNGFLNLVSKVELDLPLEKISNN